MLKDIFQNYEAFYTMVLSSTMMSNVQTAELEADAKRIIEFIGKAYKLEDKLIEDCIGTILDELSTLGLTTDQQAVYSSRRFGDEYSDKDALFDIKGDVLATLHALSAEQNAPININPGWFDYSHYKTYQADVRFAKIDSASASGIVIATRQVGILKMLGIGCKKSAETAIYRFKQCAFWGDMPSMCLLAYAYALNGEEARSATYYEVAELAEKYLNSGYTVLPEEAKAAYSEEARTYYAYISSIKQDIVFAYNKARIDFSFLEAIFTEKLDYFAKMNFINNYSALQWKDVTNSAAKPIKFF